MDSNKNMFVEGCIELSGELQSLMNFNKACNGYGFYQLFLECSALKSIKNLSINATQLNESCYHSLFQKCNNLIEICEKLPANSLKSSCYAYMFDGCTSLKYTPLLPAKILAYSCYEGMFRDCLKLICNP